MAEESVLVLAKFMKPPYVSFPEVVVGGVRFVELSVVNEASFNVTVKVEKFPWKRGDLTVSRTEFGVCANGKENLTFTWRPMTDGNMRETVLFYVSSSMGIGFKVQAILLGSCSCAEDTTNKESLVKMRKRMASKCETALTATKRRRYLKQESAVRQPFSSVQNSGKLICMRL
ncbi:unnamed protein product [Soboliphyme baturini]|uniref:ASH domain-containing protein n=1 Tax=Soboliphyme baturini TaxID=241478 RepID=A0A183J226_9BILA|nr:unnamed protein product [Soboliphyme baturini]